MDEFLKIAEVARRLDLKPRTVRNKMASGVFKKGVHYFSPKGLGPRFKWSAIVAWLEEKDVVRAQDPIPMARGYHLGDGLAKKVDATP